MAWADLDKLAVAKRLPDGRARLVAVDERTSDAITEARHLSTVVAIARVTRGRFAIRERHDDHGILIYTVREVPPVFLVDAVTAAGDLASGVRRRLKVASIGDALDVLEHHLRRKPIAKDDPVAMWTAVCELAALAGELIRAERPARWITVAGERFPLGLDLGKGEVAFPDKLAQAIALGGEGSLRSVVKLAAKPAYAPPVHRASAPADPVTAAYTHPMPLLCHRNSVPIDRLTYSLLLKDEVDTPDVPVIVYVDDRDDALFWPQDLGPPTAALKRIALANLAATKVEIKTIDVPIGKVVLVTGAYYGAEALLDRATMELVRGELGGTEMILVGMPARGHLLATDAVESMNDDGLQVAFLLLVEREYLSSLERDRISSEVLLYADEPVGRVQSNLMDTRRALRRVGVDPDA
jgi:hypothetical protein